MGHEWRRRVAERPAIATLVALVLVGQVVATVEEGLRGYLLGASALVLDTIGIVACLRATRRGDAPAWLPLAAGRFVSLLSVLALATASAVGSSAAWWLGT